MWRFKSRQIKGRSQTNLVAKNTTKFSGLPCKPNGLPQKRSLAAFSRFNFSRTLDLPVLIPRPFQLGRPFTLRITPGGQSGFLVVHSLAISVRCCLCLDDVRIWARAIAVVGAQTVIIDRIGSQPSHVVASDVEDVKILIPRHISHKRAARRDI